MGLRDALHRLHIGIFRWRFRLSFLTRLRRYPLHTIRFPVLLLLACLLGGLVAMRYCTRFPPSLFSCDYGYTIFAYWVLDVLGSRLCARENAWEGFPLDFL
jgi:hypothetical protein